MFLQRVNFQPVSHSASKFDASVLCRLFQSLFLDQHRTQLVGGASEPLYQPAKTTNEPHCIYFTQDYFASALHEVAHWCIAGPQRRQKTDYGYWYVPDGRDVDQQRAFEQVEVKPQALEWIFCVAAGFRFRISADNLNGAGQVSDDFKRAVWQQTQTFCTQVMPISAVVFANSLSVTFGGKKYDEKSSYLLEDLF